MAMLAWSISVGSGAGAGVTGSGTFDANAVLSASADLDPGTSKALALQIDDVTKVQLLIVTCNRYDGSVSVQGGAGGDPTLDLTGPIFAFGAVAQRLAGSLGTATVTADAAPAVPATVSFLIATDLS